MHICDNPKCVNPTHLIEGTHQDNNTDRANKGRGNAARGEKNGLAKLTEKKVLEIREIYSQGKTNYKKLGEEYGVDQTVIGRIVRYETWTHI
jgi:hypothetical protein